MKNNEMAKKTKEDTLNLDAILFKCRDILRQAKNSGSFFEKRDMMLTLVFLRFIGEKYEDGVDNLRQTLIKQGLDPDTGAQQIHRVYRPRLGNRLSQGDGTYPKGDESPDATRKGVAADARRGIQGHWIWDRVNNKKGYKL